MKSKTNSYNPQKNLTILTLVLLEASGGNYDFTRKVLRRMSRLKKWGSFQKYLLDIFTYANDPEYLDMNSFEELFGFFRENRERSIGVELWIFQSLENETDRFFHSRDDKKIFLLK